MLPFHQERLGGRLSWRLKEGTFQEKSKQKSDSHGDAPSTPVYPGVIGYLDNNMKFSEVAKFPLCFDLNFKKFLFTFVLFLFSGHTTGRAGS